MDEGRRAKSEERIGARRGAARRPQLRARPLVALSVFHFLFFIAAAYPAAELKLEPVADVDAFLADLERALSGAKTIVSDYRQERVLELFEEPLVTTGVM